MAPAVSFSFSFANMSYGGVPNMAGLPLLTLYVKFHVFGSYSFWAIATVRQGAPPPINRRLTISLGTCTTMIRRLSYVLCAFDPTSRLHRFANQRSQRTPTKVCKTTTEKQCCCLDQLRRTLGWHAAVVMHFCYCVRSRVRVCTGARLGISSDEVVCML